MNVPKAIESRIIDTQIKVLQLEENVKAQVNKLLSNIESEVVQRLADKDPTRPVRTAYQRQRLETLLEEVKAISTAGYKDIEKYTAKQMAEIAKYSADAAQDAVNVTLGVDLLNRSLTSEQLKTIVGNTLVEGAPSSEWWGKQAPAFQDRFKNEMRKGMAQGEALGELVARVRGKRAYLDRPAFKGIIDISRRNAESIVRTSVIAVSNQSRIEMYENNADVVRGIQWISTLDSRTTLVCVGLDGLTWDLDRKPVGHDKKFPGATAHWGCRSTQVPWLKPWEDLIKDKRLAKLLTDWENDTRASVGGQVPKSTDYETWLKEQPLSKQIDVLGKTRHDLWSRGVVSSRDFVTNSGDARTIKDLLIDNRVYKIDQVAPKPSFPDTPHWDDDMVLSDAYYKRRNEIWEYVPEQHKTTLRDYISSSGYDDLKTYLTGYQDITVEIYDRAEKLDKRMVDAFNEIGEVVKQDSIVYSGLKEEPIYKIGIANRLDMYLSTTVSAAKATDTFSAVIDDKQHVYELLIPKNTARVITDFNWQEYETIINKGDKIMFTGTRIESRKGNTIIFHQGIIIE